MHVHVRTYTYTVPRDPYVPFLLYVVDVDQSGGNGQFLLGSIYRSENQQGVQKPRVRTNCNLIVSS